MRLTFVGKVKEMFTPHDMSVGRPWKRILEFAMPMLIGNIVQQLYNTVDAIVVGRSKWGSDALAAVGNAGPILNLLLALFVGISTGAGILVSQYYGAKDKENLSRVIGNCITVTGIASVVIMIVGPMLTDPLLKLVGTLPSMYDGCRDYLNIFFIGIAGFFFYNIFAGVLRGLGDSFSSLLFLVVASLLNVVLDLLLVNSMGVAGVALATIIAQAISAVLCLMKLTKLRGIFELNKAALKPNKACVSRIVTLGIPSGITQAIFSCAMLVVQALINSFGDAAFVACNVIIMRVDGFAMMPNFSFGQAVSTFAGQNVGAKKLDRLYKGNNQGTMMALGTALVMTPLVLIFGKYIMGLFTRDAALVDLSMSMMYIIAPGYIAMSISQCLSGTMRGAGDTVTPMWISFITTVALRVPVAYGLVYLGRHLGWPVLTQEKMVFVSLLVCWVIGALIHIVCYKTGGWKKRQVRQIEEELLAESEAK